MSNTLNDIEPKTALCLVAADFHARGWMAGTAGNLSVRIGNETFWLTASGKPKGRLNEEDFVRLDLDGKLLETSVPTNRPSAEESIHRVLYRLFPKAGACLHVHTIDACIATRRFAKNDLLRLPNIEMIKGFDIWQQQPDIDLPVFENILEVQNISENIDKRFSAKHPDITALMIRDHGVTVWGNDLQDAYNRLETLEFIMSFMARQKD